MFDTRINNLKTALSIHKSQKEKLAFEVGYSEERLLKLLEGERLCTLCLEDEINLKDHAEDIANAFLKALFHEEATYTLAPKLSKDGVTVEGVSPMVTFNGLTLPPHGHGGGCGNCVGLAHRFLWLWLHPELTPFLFLDEPIVNSDIEKWERLEQLILDLNKDIPVGIMVITHSGARFQTTYQVTQSNGVSRVHKVH